MRRLLDVLQAASDYLAGKGVENFRLVTEQLMGHVLKCPRLQLYLRFDANLDDVQLDALRAGVRRLAAHEPLQYVVGETDFMGHRFKVDRRALIPRPETEILVETILKDEPLRAVSSPAVADVGAGSGCVAISLALGRLDARVTGFDASNEALALARENAALNGVAGRVEFRLSDLLAGVAPASFDAIAANLPYIPSAECDRLPRNIRDYEPRQALDGGEDGMSLVRRVIEAAPPALKAGGALFLETGCDQVRLAVGQMNEHGYTGVDVRQDLAGRERIVIGRKAI